MSELFKFAEFELDTSAYKLRHNGASVAIEPLVFDLLVLLVRKVGSVVTRDELIELIWDGRFVSESTLSTAIKSARKALGDTGNAQRFIRTARGRGFEFVGELEEINTPPETDHHLAPSLHSALYIRSVLVGGKRRGRSNCPFTRGAFAHGPGPSSSTAHHYTLPGSE